MNQEIKQAIQEIKKAVIGKDEVIMKIFVTLLSKGHILSLIHIYREKSSKNWFKYF